MPIKIFSPHIDLQIIHRTYLLVLFLFSLFFGALFSEVPATQELSLKECLLPNDHPLQKRLKNLFINPEMFKSPEHLRHAGFYVLKRVHRGLMVASHPSIKNYLFKKFQNKISQQKQLKNYLRRVKGSRALSHFIQANHLRHIVTPQKWLYPLPKQFSDPKTKERTYILIVEKIDICGDEKDLVGEVAQKYYSMELDILRELCLVLYHFRGLDSMLHNMPFTHQNKIAFIDTEKWHIKRDGFLHNVMSYLSKDRQAYALSILQQLKERP